MAVYKVIQDIEAEDNFLGPLTLKQFIFAGITALSLYLGFIFITKNLWYLALPLLPLIGVGAFLAFPWGRDQPTEIWLLAKLRFLFKPRRRIWDQSGVQELVTITAPKNSNIQYTNNLSQTEVKSRLRALADTIDSRGWAVKNVNVNLYTPQTAIGQTVQSSDRLIDLAAMPQEVPATEIFASDDIMDPQNNPLAQQLDAMINTSSKGHRQAALEHMEDVREGKSDMAAGDGAGAPPPNYWFINQPDPAGMTAGMSVLGKSPPTGQDDYQSEALSKEEKALLDQLHKDQAKASTTPIYGHLKVIQPLSKQKKGKNKRSEGKNKVSSPGTPNQVSASSPTPQPPATRPVPAPVTPPPDPAILELAINNDRDVASLAREANAKLNKPPDEVVIQLH